MIFIGFILLNVTVLQGCNYAPIGEVCAPQYDLPHWYDGSSDHYTKTYSLYLSNNTFYFNGTTNLIVFNEPFTPYDLHYYFYGKNEWRSNNNG